MVETPYHANTGAVMLTTVLHSYEYAEIPLRLGAPGMYRVRVSCRRTPPEIPGFEAAAGDLWRMQFWAHPGRPQPPRWPARSKPAVRPPGTGWETVLGLSGREVLHAVRVAAGNGDATEEQIAAAYMPWSNSSGDWSSPLSEDLSAYAVQLGVRAPATRSELLQLLVTAGPLIADTADEVTRYRLATSPPHALKVLRLPDRQVAMIRSQEASHRYTSFAADLVAVAVWSRGRTVSTPLAELAARLLATEEEIRGALHYGTERGLLSTSSVTFTALV